MTFVKPWQYLLAGVVAVLVFGSAGLWYVQYVNRTHPAPWPMLQGDSGGRFATRAVFPTEKPDALWSYSIEEPHWVAVAPVIGEGNVVYFGDRSRLVALDASGKLQWSWNSSAPIGSLALGRHGDLYVLEPGLLVALDSQGRRTWSHELPSEGGSPLIVGQGGVIYLLAEDLHAISDAGETKWVQAGTNRGLLVETPNGEILYADDRYVFAFTATGEKAWSRQMSDVVLSIAVGPDGRIYVRTRGSLAMLDQKGVIKGSLPAQGSPLTLSVDGEYVQAGLTRWSREIDPLWTAQLDGPAAVSYLDAEGKALIFAMGEDQPFGQLALLDEQGQELWRLDDMLALTLPAIGSDGRICFGGLKKGIMRPELYCMGTRQD